MANCNAAAGMEMPGYAATDLKGVQTVGTIKGGRNAAQAVISDFKKKLDSLAAEGQPMMTVQTMDTPTEDFSMATNSAAQELTQGVVGILEGFGLLDGQTDMGNASADAVQTATVSPQAPATAVEAQQAQTSGQFARMLTNEQPGGTAADVLQQPTADAEKYSGSLESTNSAAVGVEMEMSDDEAVIWQLKTKMAADAPQMAQSANAAPQTEQIANASPQTVQAATTVPQTAQTVATAVTEAQVTTSDAALTSVTGTETGGHDKTQEQSASETTASTTSANMSVDTVATRAPLADASVKTEGTQSTEVPTESSFVKDNVIRIVDKASASVQEGKYEFDVDLKPDFLGKVSIRLTMQDGEIRMHVRTDDPAVKGMFSDQTSTLTSALKEKGIVLSAVDVSYQDPTAAGREASAQSGNGGGQRREGQAGWTVDRYGSGDMFEPLVPVEELLGGSSVEYLA